MAHHRARQAFAAFLFLLSAAVHGSSPADRARIVLVRRMPNRTSLRAANRTTSASRLCSTIRCSAGAG